MTYNLSHVFNLLVRPGYEPRKLVCDEEEERDKYNLSFFSLRNCSRPLSPEKLLTIIIKKNDTETFAVFDGKTNYLVVYADRQIEINTDYIFLGEFSKIKKKVFSVSDRKKSFRCPRFKLFVTFISFVKKTSFLSDNDILRITYSQGV